MDYELPPTLTQRDKPENYHIIAAITRAEDKRFFLWNIRDEPLSEEQEIPKLKISVLNSISSELQN